MSDNAVRVALLSVLVMGAACTVYRQRANQPHDDPALYAAVAAPAPSPSPPLAWAGESEYAIVVRKRERTLSLYHRTQQERVYPIVLGIAPDGPKTYQGDLRTPEGVYRIVAKRPHERWSRFLLLSYPNEIDIRRYAMAVSERRVPIIDGEPPGPGGAVGIHGSDREDSNTRGVNWTWGCISMLNQDVSELYDRVPLGTPVLIEQ